MDFPHCVSLLRTRINNREIQLLIRGIELHEEVKDHVQHLVRPGIFPVDLIDDDDRLRLVLQGLAQHKLGLCLRAVMRVDDQQHAIHHLHDAFHFPAEIGMPRRINNVDVVILVFERGVLRLDRDSFFFFEVHRVHDAFLDLLIRPKGPGLAKQLVDERRLSMVNMGNNCNITYTFHRNRRRIGKMAAPNQIVNEV